MASTASPLSDVLPASGQAAVRPCFTLRAVDWRTAERPEVRLAWDALAACAGEPNPFLESWYLLPALHLLDPGARAQLLLFEADGDLAGVMPLAASRRYYGWPIPHLTGWTHPNAFLGAPLVAAGLERAFWRALLAWADRNAGLALFLHLPNLPLGGPVHRALVDVLAEQGRAAGLVHREERALLASRQTPAAYFEASLSGKKRKELRRQSARLAELGEVAIVRRHDGEALSGWIEDFLALEKAGWKGRAGSALACNPATAALFWQALSGAAAQGRLERLSLTLDGRPIAMLASFVCPPGLFSYKTAFDERYARYSPGVLLQRANLDVLDRDDIAWSDSCASADHPMIDHIWRERRPIGRISITIGGSLRRAAFARLLGVELARSAARPAPSGATSVFSAEARDAFARNYPEVPHLLDHALGRHPLLELDALADLAESLPEAAVEYNRADLPIGVDGKPDATGMPIGETIRNVATSGSWAVLKNVEQNPTYADLLESLLAELRPQIEARTGAMLKTQAFIFISSPGAVTPYHFDPEHNILLQIRGRKVMTQFPAGDAAYAPDTVHEAYHTGGARELTWRDDLAAGGRAFALGPGEALFVPVMAPHFVRNGPEPSVSLSITWRSEWSFAEADARAFNAVLRRCGLRPKAPGRWPRRNRAKALGWRLLRKLTGSGTAA